MKHWLAGLMLMWSGWASADCAQVQLIPQQPLAAGVIRTPPGAAGFLALHPSGGVSLSHPTVSHQGAFGPAMVLIRGPSGLRFDLALSAQANAPWDTHALALTALLVRVNQREMQMDWTHGVVPIALPNGGPRMSETQIEIGAMFRYSDTRQPQTASYQLWLRCVPGSSRLDGDHFEPS